MDEPLSIAYYCTGHGLGHATRAIEVCKYLIQGGHSVVVVTGAPASAFLRELPSKQFTIRKAVLDCGAKQKDAFSVDMKGSLEEYHRTSVMHRDTLLDTEVAWLRATRMDLVVTDIVPIVCAAARAAGVPCVGVSNFSWDFIYSEYLTSVGSNYRKMVWQIAEDYAKADMLLRLPGHCPMPAFREVIDVPLVVRHARKTREQVFGELGLAADQRLAVFIYGGQPPGQWELRRECLPAGWVCVVCSGGKAPGGQALPDNFVLAKPDVYTPDLVGACDCVVGKIGYGTMSECLAHGRPLVFVRRDFFNEEPFLRKMLEMHGLGIEMKPRDFLEGNWGPFLEAALAARSAYSDATNGAEAGSVRLRDAIVWGYMMQRHSARATVEVPEWYTRGHLPPGLTSPSASPCPSPSPLHQSSPSRLGTATPGPFHVTAATAAGFSVLAGQEALGRCPDTLDFLQTLARLRSHAEASSSDAHAALPEFRAATRLFNWEDEIYVTRAPGRLDVMGGIADYSGSAVLQLPIAQACHVACQRQPVGKQQLWKHIQARQAATGPQPALRVVSFHADATNRGPTFDMDLAELERDGAPIPYEQARAHFKEDPARSWAAYVAGALVVLMHECALRFPDGIAMLISSSVPEGKGVSSSAAVEVGVMKAVAAAHGLDLDGRQLALLCQKVENLVVGAPCGVMDQMTSSLGEPGTLFSMTCQPAEVDSPVAIPDHTRFWGIDSGIRHSVGGADYGTVRAGAFMGLRILSESAGLIQRQGSALPRLHSVNMALLSVSPDTLPLGGGYLTNIAPSEFSQTYEEDLPETMTGSDFLSRYGRHWDAATEVVALRSYPVRLPTAHPVFEHFRVHAFAAVLQAGAEGPANLALLGELMYQSHASYSRCGLGSEGTDRIVALVREEVASAKALGLAPPLYGAKITGGGSGGTVCVIGEASEAGQAAIERVVQRYSSQTGGYSPQVFTGSSLGADAFGHLVIKPLPA
ncbi:hypothetical protein WJX72_006956 [[Myrmecia] bisecta]|uniref:L-arabinokinase n=1 Tax=[Myrmecia] bisecta TaxID=41462 RepID=A0AAW1P047_9CHLO